MAYSRGSSSNIIVGAAAIFTHKDGPIGLDSDGKITDAQAALDLPALTASTTSYKETLSNDSAFRNIGYTSNGLELAFQPDFGEVAVDQLLDVARLFKQGMTVNLNTSFAEATLENLLVAIAADNDDLDDPTPATGLVSMRMSAGDIGDVPLERGIVAVGRKESMLHTVHSQLRMLQYQQSVMRLQCLKYHSVFFQTMTHHTVRS